MKVLLTGATGLVGTELVSLLLKNGISVNYLTTSKDKIQEEPNYKGFFWNPSSGEIDDQCLDEVDAIINLAGSPIAKRWTANYKDEILKSRVSSVNAIYDLLKNKSNSVHQFISASAIGIYPSSFDKVYSEDETQFDNSFLSQVVQQWEAAANKIASLGITVAKVRTGLVLSGKGGALTELAAPIKYGFGAAFGNGQQMQSWVHLDDLAGIYAYILHNELGGVYNAVAPHPVTNHTLVELAAKVMDKPFFMPNIPKFMMDLILGEMHTLLFDSQNVSAKKIISEGYQFKYLSLEKALQVELKH